MRLDPDESSSRGPTASTERWQFRMGGGARAWRACLPFIFLTGFSFALGWAYPEHFREEFGEAGYYVSLASSIGGVALGLLALAFRTGATIDRASGEVVAWWGLFGSWFQRHRALVHFNAVLLDRLTMRSQGRTVSHLIVRLEGPHEKLNLIRTADYCVARRNADQVALLTGFRYRDRTDGAEQDREPDPLIVRYFRG